MSDASVQAGPRVPAGPLRPLLLLLRPPLPLSLSLCSADNFDERVRL